MSLASCVPECRHILPGGQKCRALALRDKHFCPAHLHRQSLTEANRLRNHSVVLPPLETWEAVLMSIDQVLAAFAAGKISRRETSTCLYALQLASRVLARKEQAQQALTPSADSHAAAGSRPAAAPNPSPAGSESALEDASSQAVEASPAEAAVEAEVEAETEAARYDPEPKPPLTRAQIRERRREIDMHLQNYYEGWTFYTGRSGDELGPQRQVVLDYLRKNIEPLEAERKALDLLEAPDPPCGADDLCALEDISLDDLCSLDEPGLPDDAPPDQSPDPSPDRPPALPPA